MRAIGKFKFDMKKEILIINLIFSEHDLPITAFENNPAALSQLFAAHFLAAAHHLGTPDILRPL